MDQKIVRKLEKKIEEAIAEVIVEHMRLKRLPLISAIGADGDRKATDEAAIRKSVETYVAAFNKGDAKALAAMTGWIGYCWNEYPARQTVAISKDEILD